MLTDFKEFTMEELKNYTSFGNLKCDVIDDYQVKYKIDTGKEFDRSSLVKVATYDDKLMYSKNSNDVAKFTIYGDDLGSTDLYLILDGVYLEKGNSMTEPDYKDFLKSLLEEFFGKDIKVNLV